MANSIQATSGAAIGTTTNTATTLIDLLTIPGVDREILTCLPLRDVARLAQTSQALRFGPLDWMLDRELLIQLQCPTALRLQILDTPSAAPSSGAERTRKPLSVRAWSRTVKTKSEGVPASNSIWEALRPIVTNTPLKSCYGLELRIEHPVEASCSLHFSNEVFCHVKDITIFETGYHSMTNYTVKPKKLSCLCLAKDCCFEGERKYYWVKGKFLEGTYYCNQCLERNVFCKLRKIRRHPGSHVIWNGERRNFLQYSLETGEFREPSSKKRVATRSTVA